MPEIVQVPDGHYEMWTDDGKLIQGYTVDQVQQLYTDHQEEKQACCA